MPLPAEPSHLGLSNPCWPHDPAIHAQFQGFPYIMPRARRSRGNHTWHRRLLRAQRGALLVPRNHTTPHNTTQLAPGAMDVPQERQSMVVPNSGRHRVSTSMMQDMLYVDRIDVPRHFEFATSRPRTWHDRPSD